jgi:hypothetical protein
MEIDHELALTLAQLLVLALSSHAHYPHLPTSATLSASAHPCHITHICPPLPHYSHLPTFVTLPWSTHLCHCLPLPHYPHLPTYAVLPASAHLCHITRICPPLPHYPHLPNFATLPASAHPFHITRLHTGKLKIRWNTVESYQKTEIKLFAAFSDLWLDKKIFFI